MPNFVADGGVKHLAFLTFSIVLVSHPSFLQAGENSAQVYFYHALKSKQEGRPLMAERLFRKALDLEPQNPDFHFELGNLYIERENITGARMELEQTVMISPGHKPAHYNLGLVYRELGLMGEARDEFEKVLELDPTHVKAQLQIGYTYQEEGFFDDARFAFQRAREMDITDPSPIRALEDLAEAEREAQLRQASTLERSFQNLPSASPLLGQSQVPQPQVSSKSALLQAGALLLQEFLARRSQSPTTSETKSS